MTQPTQELPPWLSASTVVVTNPGGSAVTTTTVVRLPLTYYGPSIPLGNDGVWTWGGLTSPASTPTPSPTPSPSMTATPASSPSATPAPTSLPVPTTSAKPLPSSSSSSTRPAVIPSPSHTHPVPSIPSPLGFSSTGLSWGAKLGIILGSILGSVLLLLLLLLFLRWRSRRHQGYHTPIWTQWVLVPPHPGGPNDNGSDEKGTSALLGSRRRPGEGSPRHSGDEADPFLKSPTLEGAKTTHDLVDIGFPLVAHPRLGRDPDPEVLRDVSPQPSSLAQSIRTLSAGWPLRSSRSSLTGSGYGTLVEDPNLIGIAHGGPERTPTRGDSAGSGVSLPGSSIGTHIITPSLLNNIVEAQDRRASVRGDSQSSGDSPVSLRNGSNRPGVGRSLRTVASAPSIPEGFSPLIPPAPLNPDRLPTPVPGAGTATGAVRVSHTGSLTTNTQRSSASEWPAEVLTARRVRAEDLGPRSPGATLSPELAPQPQRTSWIEGPLGGLSRLSRLTWFRNQPPTASTSRPRPHSMGSAAFDVEAAGTTGPGFVTPTRDLGFQFDEQGRPISTVSTGARSAVSGTSTIYHDALEELDEPPPVPPLPRAYLTSASQDRNRWLARRSVRYEEVPTAEPPEPAPASTSAPGPDPEQEVDILDLPAPRAASPFNSGPRYPPGLSMPKFRESGSGSSREGPDEEIDVGTSMIDVLEDSPPAPGETWRTLATGHHAALRGVEGLNLGVGSTMVGFGMMSVGDDVHGRRTTFGMPTIVHPQEPTTTSEAGSLHSQHSPNSMRSTGSAPASSRRAFSSQRSSASRRPGHAQNRSVSSGGPSLSHSGSITSDGRRRRFHGHVSPAVSALGKGNTPQESVRFTPREWSGDTNTTEDATVVGSSDLGHLHPPPREWEDVGKENFGIRLVGSGRPTDQEMVE